MRALAALRPEELHGAREGAARAATSWSRRVAQSGPAAGAELRRRRHRHAGRRRAVHGARRRGGVRRLGHLQERGSGGARARDRARHHALGGTRGGAGGDRAGSARRCRASRWRRSPSTSASRTGAGERRDGRARVGVLALQGDFDGAPPRAGAARASRRSRVRTPSRISTASTRSSSRAASRRRCSKGLARDGLDEPLARLRSRRAARCSAPAPARSCSRAGGEPPAAILGLARRRRRAQRLRHAGRFVRRVADATRCRGLRCVFIRAPRCARPGPRSRCWRASTASRCWCARAASSRATFHPELGEDPRVHALLLELAGEVA